MRAGVLQSQRPGSELIMVRALRRAWCWRFYTSRFGSIESGHLRDLVVDMFPDDDLAGTSMQSGVFRLRLLKNREIEVGIFPER